MSLYNYKAIVTKVYDGDTITVDIDLGLGVWKHGEKIRLQGIDAPELKGKTRNHGLLSRDKLRELILGKEVTIETMKDKKGKYGRYVAEVFLKGLEGSVNSWLVNQGLAVFKEY